MGLLKERESDFGATATYWIIGAMSEDFFGHGRDVTIFGFVDEPARRSGKKPLAVARFQITAPAYVPDQGREAVYEIIKRRPEFEGAEDC